MTSLLDLITQASTKIGSDPVASLSEDTRDAEVWSSIWLPVLGHCLDTTPWKFSTKTVELSRLVGSPADPNFQYAFQLPVDFRTNRAVMGSGGQILSAGYIVEGDQLLAVYDRVILKYGRSFTETDIDRLPSWFQTFYVAALAYEACEPLVAVGSVSDRCLRDAGQALRQARIADGWMDPAPMWGVPSSWRSVRWS